MANSGAEPARTLLICAPPGSERNHECWKETNPKQFLETLSERLGGRFAPGSRLIDGGAAALVGYLPEAAQRLKGDVDHILLIGVDSLINATDMAALRAAGRLQGQTAQGVIPGEGAGAVVLGRGKGAMRVRSVGIANEDDTVGGERQSQGRGMVQALTRACNDECPESSVEFVVGNFNGERYQALELLIYRAPLLPHAPDIYGHSLSRIRVWRNRCRQQRPFARDGRGCVPAGLRPGHQCPS